MIKAFIARAILKLVVEKLLSAVAEIVAQKRIVEGIINALRGDYLPKLESWQGEAADAFRAEVDNRVMQEINTLLAALGGMQVSVEKGCNCIQDMDKKCVSHGDNLADTYRNIVKW